MNRTRMSEKLEAEIAAVQTFVMLEHIDKDGHLWCPARGKGAEQMTNEYKDNYESARIMISEGRDSTGWARWYVSLFDLYQALEKSRDEWKARAIEMDTKWCNALKQRDELAACISMATNEARGVECPDCNNSGVVAVPDRNGWPEPMQCQWCYEMPWSVFNVEQLQSRLNEIMENNNV